MYSQHSSTRSYIQDHCLIRASIPTECAGIDIILEDSIDVVVVQSHACTEAAGQTGSRAGRSKEIKCPKPWTRRVTPALMQQ
ncbi:hypothetical protein TWF569_010063 [Orbilia oligospora]|uniref:Uncharacterized protein n=1 Tax=Orbilia oligospora TaxID=2813651 RepID=A0A7C8J5M6_ORBOL|nr:hypothetical protein TWF102_006899 [Orbilia oligospora]KAF3098964.1 hypothetical protein TWF706_006553 [Orbilia oligospora]KAF3105559.1 hypothetical protein TWF103_006618 [Orbilia oligospora]KAF3134796.1 hypothetical protein TWF569_010063 [Orbilia oligospora]